MTTFGRSLARLLPTFVLLFAGSSCGGGSPAPRPVASLSDAEAQSLCQQFFTAACAAGKDGSADPDPSCTGCDPCTQTTSLATIRTLCGSGITDTDVKHCISSGFDMPTCTGPERGGCMFDVGDMLCPGP